ncbi:MAG: exodeoxyribonuclease VII large subunit [Phycisphaerae bacterium]|nr:exodeoxyribonuclease VII large subunit [Phycisphaerae bacterium]
MRKRPAPPGLGGPVDASVPSVPPDGTGGSPAPAGPAGHGGVLSVTMVSELIGSALRAGLPERVRVAGEIGNFSDRTHWYFELKDAGAVLSCVMFAQAAARIGFRPGPGQLVVISGRIGHFPRQGRTQMYADSMEPVGAGAMELALRALLEEIRRLGWLDPARKRPLPRFPRRVAVVTSRTGAALQDVLDTMRRRCPAVEVALVDVLVQGPEAAASVARALRWLSLRHDELGIDAVILTRGGGSMADLWSFNDRAVARAVVECSVPVVAAIGHETDTTLAELVADERAATPTQAAMRLTPDRVALREGLDTLGDHLRSVMRRRLALASQRATSAARHGVMVDPSRVARAAGAAWVGVLRRLHAAMSGRATRAARRAAMAAAALEAQRPVAVLERRAAALRVARDRLRASVRAALDRASARLDAPSLARAARRGVDRLRVSEQATLRQLELVGPQGVLRRGFSCTFDPSGRLVRSVEQIASGQELRTRVADGTFASIVKGQSGEPTRDPLPEPPRRAARPRRRGPGIAPDGPGLFG